MNITAITIGSYPYGEATTNRNISILKGLSELGHNVELIILSPTDRYCMGTRVKSGFIEGVKFEYTSKSVEWPNNVIKKSIILVFSISKALHKLKDKIRTKKIDVILLLLSKPYLMHPFILFAKKYNLNIYHEQNELPEVIFKNKNIISIINIKYYINLIRKLTGIYVISNYLKNYFAEFIEIDRICLINMTVDHTRFYNIWPSPFKFKYIAFCGTMYGNKDGIRDLIDAYETVKIKVGLKLVLIGDILDERAKYITDLIKEKGLTKNVVLTGSIVSTDIPRYLQNAEILVLARPDSIQARAGFPTKLGEYLLTQKPVIVTSTGEIPLFLKEGENAFLVKPADSVHFAEKILFVFNNYQLALNVAKNGKNLAMKCFNYRIESKKLASFIEISNSSLK